MFHINPFLIPIIFWGIILTVSMIRDIRRFRNSIYMILFLMTCFFGIVLLTENTDYDYLPIVLFLGTAFIITLVIPVTLIINGFVIMKHEGKRLSCMLSLLFGIFIIAGAVALILSMYKLDYDDKRNPVRITLFLIGYGVFYVSLIALAFLLYSLMIKIIPHRRKYRYVIVLGAGLLHGDKVSKLLSDRLDKAAKVWQKAGEDAFLICSGGRGEDETISEAEAMKKYLTTHGIPEDRVLLENRSTDTMENLTFCKKLIDEDTASGKCVIVTSGYHVLRSLIYSRKIGLTADGIGAHTAMYYWPSAMIREYVALVQRYIIPFALGFLLTTPLFMRLIGLI